MPRSDPKQLRVLLACLDDRQAQLVRRAFEVADLGDQSDGLTVRLTEASGRGLPVLEAAADADAVIFPFHDESLPGEASHALASYPNIKVIGLDALARVRVVLGSPVRPLHSDLPTVVRWLVDPNGRSPEADTSDLTRPSANTNVAGGLR